MRKVILGVAVSLDGFIEGPNGEYDWCPPPSQTEMEAFMNKIDIIFMGRKSFEMMGSAAFPGKVSYVFSNSLKSVKGATIISGEIIKAVNEIKNQEGKDIWLFGGASLTTSFINEGLVDEMWLGIVPVILGAGKPLFQNIDQRTFFKFTEAVEKTGYLSVGLKYEAPPLKKRSKK